MLLLKNMNIGSEPERTSKDFLWIDNKKFWTIFKTIDKEIFYQTAKHLYTQYQAQYMYLLCKIDWLFANVD